MYLLLSSFFPFSAQYCPWCEDPGAGTKSGVRPGFQFSFEQCIFNLDDRLYDYVDSQEESRQDSSGEDSSSSSYVYTMPRRSKIIKPGREYLRCTSSIFLVILDEGASSYLCYVKLAAAAVFARVEVVPVAAWVAGRKSERKEIMLWQDCSTKLATWLKIFSGYHFSPFSCSFKLPVTLVAHGWLTDAATRMESL